ncbi:hypothetical protein M569_00258, partial [Genlisea aurea]
LRALYAQSFRRTLAPPVLPRLLARTLQAALPFFTHAILLDQAFAHCPRFPTAAPRGSPGRVSVPVWLIVRKDQLSIIGLIPTRYAPVRHF